MRTDIFLKANKGLSSHHRPTSYFCSGKTMRFMTEGSVDQITLDLFNFLLFLWGLKYQLLIISGDNTKEEHKMIGST